MIELDLGLLTASLAAIYSVHGISINTPANYCDDAPMLS